MQKIEVIWTQGKMVKCYGNVVSPKSKFKERCSWVFLIYTVMGFYFIFIFFNSVVQIMHILP